MKTKKVCGKCGYDLVEVKGSCGCRASKKYFCRQCKIVVPAHKITTVKID